MENRISNPDLPCHQCEPSKQCFGWNRKHVLISTIPTIAWVKKPLIELIKRKQGARIWRRVDGALLMAYVGRYRSNNQLFVGWKIKEPQEWYGQLRFPFAVDIGRKDVRRFIEGLPLLRWDDHLAWFRGVDQ
jgi:hypothetical protein